MNGAHCGDLRGDRFLGEKWEKNFMRLALEHGLNVTAHQIGRKQSALSWCQTNDKPTRLVLPDIVVWSFPGQHHEIKHKNPTRRNEYGLESYRFDSLRLFQETTKQPVFYTIHNHDLSGGRYGEDNRLEHWVSASISILDGAWCRIDENGSSYCNGEKINTKILYWSVDLFVPLECVLNGEFRDDILDRHPAQAELIKAKAELLRIQESNSVLQRQRNLLLDQLNNVSKQTKPRYSPNGKHQLSYAFELFA